MYGHANPTIRTTAEGETVGPKMHAAVRLIGWHGPEPSRNQLAIAVGPNGSQDYGYRIVNRCIHAGLLAVDADHPDAEIHGRGAVVLTEKGEAYLSDHEDDL